jgi:hypothetical protein
MFCVVCRFAGDIICHGMLRMASSRAARLEVASLLPASAGAAAPAIAASETTNRSEAKNGRQPATCAGLCAPAPIA